MAFRSASRSKLATLGVLLVASTLAVLGVVGPGAAAGAASLAATGPCAGANGVTVVVDFGAFGRGVEVGCAPGDPASGYDALRGAGFTVDGAARSPSFLCRINGLPNAAQDACVMPPPATAYWSYWIADRGKGWCYSNAGMYGRDPQRGTVEGWSFVNGSGASAVAAPRSSTFAPVPGAGTTGASCDAATTATVAPPPTSPRPSSAPEPAGAAPPSVAPAIPRSGGDAAAGAPAPGDRASQPQTPAPTDGSAAASPDTPEVAAATTSSTTTVPGTTGAAAAAEGDGAGERASDDRAEISEEATSSVALADSGRSGPGGPLGTALAAGGVAAIAAGAVIVNRRRFHSAAIDGATTAGPQPADTSAVTVEQAGASDEVAS